MGRTSILDLIGNTPISGGMEDAHASIQSIVNVMKVNISVTWWINKIMCTWLLIARNRYIEGISKQENPHVNTLGPAHLWAKHT